MEFSRVPSRAQRAAVCNRNATPQHTGEIGEYDINYTHVDKRLQGNYNFMDYQPHEMGTFKKKGGKRTNRTAAKHTAGGGGAAAVAALHAQEDLMNRCFDMHLERGIGGASASGHRNGGGVPVISEASQGHNFSQNVLVHPQCDIDVAPPLWDLDKMQKSIQFQYNRAASTDTAKRAIKIENHLSRQQRAKFGYLSAGDAMSSRSMPGLRVKYGVVEVPLGQGAVAFGPGYDFTSPTGKHHKQKNSPVDAALSPPSVKNGKRPATASGSRRGSLTENTTRPRSAKLPTRSNESAIHVKPARQPFVPRCASAIPKRTNQPTSQEYGDPLSSFNATKRRLGRAVSWGRSPTVSRLKR